MHKLIMALALPLMCAVEPGAAQTKSTDGSWASFQRLMPEATVRIRTADGRYLRGYLDSVNDGSLVINTATGQETLERSGISQISFKPQGHRGRNALRGLGIGAGMGLALGAIYDSGYPHCKGWLCLEVPYGGKATFTPFGALVGLGVGGLWPTGGWREVYRAK